MSGQGAAYNDLFLVPGGSSSSHMVAISTPGNQVSVIAVTGEEGPAACRKVRTLTGITSPQKVCMVTRYKALILCGDRQLKLYDLDRGCLLLKLKGVMNQKMPYFACIDEKNCIALSRNRMTVNIMSLETGMCARPLVPCHG